MDDVFKVADLLIQDATGRFPDEVDLIGYYGSYALGTATERSDLDIFYVPADGKQPTLNRAFLLDGRLFDFWGIGWDMLEGFATGRTRGWAFAPALVFHTEILYARSGESRGRLQALKDRIVELQSEASRPRMIRRALAAFPMALAHLGNLRLVAIDGEPSDLRHAAWNVVTAVLECLTLVNQRFLQRGYADLTAQLEQMELKPSELSRSITVLTTSLDPEMLTETAERLVMATRRLLRDAQASLPPEENTLNFLGSAYPELRGTLDKILSSAERGDAITASASARSAQVELALMLAGLNGSGWNPDFHSYSEFAALYREREFPDLMATTEDSRTELASATRDLDRQLRAWLIRNGIKVSEYPTLKAFQDSL